MKRVVWLVLAVFLAALAQVRPVDALEAKGKACPCCHPGSCEMPGCCPQTSSAPTSINLAQMEAVGSLPAPRFAQPASRLFEGAFYSLFVGPVATRGPLVASAKAAPPAPVPLFQAHCSLLI
jgi:hypothetical protein